jgi:hypothetical protein
MLQLHSEQAMQRNFKKKLDEASVDLGLKRCHRPLTQRPTRGGNKGAIEQALCFISELLAMTSNDSMV